MKENLKTKVNAGDIAICDAKDRRDAGVEDPREIWPAKDRFLNMLILGPTGCGKTRKSLLPMILQDIQNPEWGLTVLEPRGDLALKAHLMAERFGRKSLYFDPTYKNCPKFNPLAGREYDVVENIVEVYKRINPDSPQYFLDLGEELLRNALKVLKRLDKANKVDGKYSTLICLSRLLKNSGGQGRELVNNFCKIRALSESEASENRDIAQWFLNDYFPEHSKIYENTSLVRAQITKLVTNEYLREVLNPDFAKGEKSDINFDEILATGSMICISTAEGTLRELSRYLSYFIIQALESSAFHRYATKAIQFPHAIYIDEFWKCASPGFINVLSLGQSCRISSVLTAEARAEMALGFGKDGEGLVNLLSAKVRSVVLYDGTNKEDLWYYAEELEFPLENINNRKIPGDILYRLMKNGVAQPSQIGFVSFIPEALDAELNSKALEYKSTLT